jgi:predicted permease
VRRDDLLKPDVVSELILLGVGALLLAILFLILIAVLARPSSAQNQSSAVTCSVWKNAGGPASSPRLAVPRY